MSTELLNTIIITSGSVLVALIGALGAREGIRRHRRRRRDEVSSDERDAVARYTSDPGQFVKDVLESNRQLTLRVESTERRADQALARVSAVEQALQRVTRTLRMVREAFREYIRDVRRRWGEPSGPPEVSAHIRELLAEDDLDDTFQPEPRYRLESPAAD